MPHLCEEKSASPCCLLLGSRHKAHSSSELYPSHVGTEQGAPPWKEVCLWWGHGQVEDGEWGLGWDPYEKAHVTLEREK